MNRSFLLSLAAVMLAASIPLHPLRAADDGLVWIDLRLVDEDAAGGRADILCQTSETQMTVPVIATGSIGGSHRVKLTIPWRPCEETSAHIGLPREGTSLVRLRLPETLLIAQRAYFIAEPATIKLAGSERLVVIEVSMRRLATATIRNNSVGIEPTKMFDRYVLPAANGDVYLLPGVRLLTTPKGYRAAVTLIDETGQRFALTQPAYPETFLELSAAFGWRYEIDLIPKRGIKHAWLATVGEPP